MLKITSGLPFTSTGAQLKLADIVEKSEEFLPEIAQGKTDPDKIISTYVCVFTLAFPLDNF